MNGNGKSTARREERRKKSTRILWMRRFSGKYARCLCACNEPDHICHRELTSHFYPMANRTHHCIRSRNDAACNAGEKASTRRSSTWPKNALFLIIIIIKERMASRRQKRIGDCHIFLIKLYAYMHSRYVCQISYGMQHASSSSNGTFYKFPVPTFGRVLLCTILAMCAHTFSSCARWSAR